MTTGDRQIQRPSVIGVLGLIALMLLTVWVLQTSTPPELSRAEDWQTDKLLLKDTEVVRLRILAQAIRSAGESCRAATTAFWLRQQSCVWRCDMERPL